MPPAEALTFHPTIRGPPPTRGGSNAKGVTNHIDCELLVSTTYSRFGTFKQPTITIPYRRVAFRPVEAQTSVGQPLSSSNQRLNVRTRGKRRRVPSPETRFNHRPPQPRPKPVVSSADCGFRGREVTFVFRSTFSVVNPTSNCGRDDSFRTLLTFSLATHAVLRCSDTVAADPDVAGWIQTSSCAVRLVGCGHPC